MHIKAILNRVQNFKSFVCGRVCWAEDASEPAIEAELRARASGRAIFGLWPPKARL